MTERIRVEIDGDSKGLKKAAAEAVASIGGVSAASKSASKDGGSLWQDAGGKWRNQAGQFATAAEKAAAGVEHVGTASRRTRGDVSDLAKGVNDLDRAIGKANRNMTAMRNAISVLRLPAAAAGAGLLAKEFGAVAGGLGAIAAAGGPAVGVLAALPQAISALGQGVGTLKLASSGVSEALKAQTAAATQAGVAAQSSASAQAAAAERVRNAKEHLADTERGATRAQNELTAAHVEAEQQLRALQQASEDTAISERGAEIALRSALARRRELRGTPGASLIDLDTSNNDVDAARSQLDQLRRTGRDQAAEVTRMKARGTNRSDVVVRAQERAADAGRDVARAQRDVASAQDDAAEATDKLSSSQTKVQQTMDALPASAQRWVRFLLEQKPKLEQLRKSSADGLFPGLERGATDALKNFDVIDAAVSRTSKMFGGLAEDAGAFIGSKGFGRDLDQLAKSNTAILDDLGHSGLNVAEALVDISVAAEPLTRWLGEMVLEGSEAIKMWADQARKSGDAAKFFDETREVLEVLGGIVGDVAEGIWNIGKAAYPVGRDLLDMLSEVTDGWADWTGTVSGQNELKDYFEKIKPTITETAGLLGDVVTAVLRISREPGNSEIIKQIRSDLLPAVEDLLKNLTGPGGLGEQLVDAASSVAEFFAEVSEGGGGLSVAVDLIGKVVKGITWLIEQGGPGVHQALAVGLAGMTLYKILGIGTAIKGIDTLIRRLGAIKSAEGLGDVVGGLLGRGAAGGAAGAAAGAAGGAAGTVAAGAGGTGAGVAGSRIAGGIALRGAGIAAGATAAALTLPLALIAMNPQLDKLTSTFDQLIDAPRGSTRFNELGKLEEGLRNAVKAGDPNKLRAVADQIKAVGAATGGLNADAWADLSKEIGKFAEAKAWAKVKGEVESSAKEFDLWEKQTGGSIKGIASAVSINMQRISGDLGKESDAGRAALSANFRMAASAVEKSMADGKTSTKEGLREIRGYMADALKLYGFSQKEANREASGQRYDGGNQEGTAQQAMTRKAVGGWIGDPGDRGRDTEVIAVGRGEAVLNAGQQDYAELGLNVAYQMGLSPYSGLDSLFRGETQPHYMAAYAGGGRVGGLPSGIVPIPGMPGESINQSILGDVQQIIRQYKARVTDGYAPSGHKAGGEHPKGLAVDLVPGAGGTWDDIDRLAAWAEPSQNHPRSPFRWVGYNGDAGHGRGDHLHLSWLQGAHVAGGDGASISDVKRAKWTGPGGALGQAGQAGLDAVRAAANARVAGIAGAGGGVTGLSGLQGAGAGPAMGEGPLRAVIRRALRHEGKYTKANENSLYRRIMQESSGNPKAVNNWDVNAKNGDPSVGLAQVIGSTFATYRDKSLPDDRTNPMANIVAAIRYMYGRYGRIVDANGQGYARGGRIRRAAGGRRANRIKAKPSPGMRALGKVASRFPGLASAIEPRGVASSFANKLPLASLTAAGTFSRQAEDADIGYGLMLRGHQRTDEQSTRSGPVSGFSDADLLTVYGQDDLARLRAQPDSVVEVVDQAAIGQHVAELQAQEQAKAGVARLVQQQRDALAEAVGVLNAGIAERTKALHGMREQAKANIARIRALTKRLEARRKDAAALRSRINGGKLKGAALRDAKAQLSSTEVETKSIAREISGLQADTDILNTTIPARDRQLQAWQTNLTDAEPSLRQLSVTSLPGLGEDIKDIQEEIKRWGATPSVSKIGLTGAGGGDAARADLLEQMLAEQRHNNYLQGLQVGALKDFQPLLTGRMVGSFAHGSRRIPYDGIAEVHRDEQIITDPEGPYGSQIPRGGAGAGATVVINFDGDLGTLFKRARASVNGRDARMTSEQIGRSTRLTMAAPGN